MIDLYSKMPNFPRIAGKIEEGFTIMTVFCNEYAMEMRVFLYWEENGMVIINGDTIKLTELGKKSYQKAIKVPRWKRLVYEFDESFKHLAD